MNVWLCVCVHVFVSMCVVSLWHCLFDMLWNFVK